MSKALAVLSTLGIVLSVSGGAYAAKGLLTGADIKNGSLTGADIASHSVGAGVFTASARASLQGSGPRVTTGTVGAAGSVGATGAAGLDGDKGAPGATGASGTSGTDGTNGTNGTPGTPGTNGTNGAPGAPGAPGSNGTVTPVTATQGATAIPTGAALVTVVSLTVPAGRYAVLAKTQIAQTGAGDSVDCFLKTAATTLDESSMKTLPALAATAVPLQAVVTTVGASTLLTVQCNVEVAGGSANFSSLIAIPAS